MNIKNSRVYFVLLAFAIMIAMNVFMAAKVEKLACDVERLNRAYSEAIESLRGVRGAVDSLPDIRQGYEEYEESLEDEQ
jgi:hypothetical protein